MLTLLRGPHPNSDLFAQSREPQGIARNLSRLTETSRRGTSCRNNEKGCDQHKRAKETLHDSAPDSANGQRKRGAE